jgi:uncharacterized protein (TIGR03437 family)
MFLLSRARKGSKVACGLLSFTILAASAATLCRGQVITTIAGTGTGSYSGDGGPANQAWIHFPEGITTDSSGNVYFADTANFRVREVTTAGIINTVAGNGMPGLSLLGSIGDGGPATSAGLYPPPSTFAGVAIDGVGNLYIADGGNNRVRKVSGGIITTFAGGGSGGDGGQANQAALKLPSGVAVDKAGNVYIADQEAGLVRMVNTSGIISTVAGGGGFTSSGDGGSATKAGFANGPLTVAVDSLGNLYIAEGAGARVRKVSGGIISTFAGNGNSGFLGDNGPAVNAEFFGAEGIVADNAGNVYIADYNNFRVRKVDTSGNITTVVGQGQSGLANDGGLPILAELQPAGLALDPSGNLYISDYLGDRIRKVTFAETPPGLSASAYSLFFAAKASSASASSGSQELTISTEGPPLNFTVTTATTSGGSAWLAGNARSGTTPATMTVTVGALPIGTYNGTLTITPTTPGYTTPITVAIVVNITATVPPAPVITDVQNGASFQTGSGYIAGSFATIRGTNLASTTDTWNASITGSGQLPTALDGVTVTFYGSPAYISYISPTQINIVAPADAGYSSDIVVNNNGASGGFTAGGGVADPAFFSWPGNQVVATHQDYSYAVAPGTFPTLTTVAAQPGEVIILWGTGFGATTPSTLPGVVVPGDQEYSTSSPVTVTINNIPATVYGAALAPGFVGEYQVAIQVPASLTAGNWPVVATAGGIDGIGAVSSPTGMVLAVQ